jgi:hypothetical protein
MLVAAAVLPHPPLLLPEVASGAAQELASVRQACSKALEALRNANPDRLVVIGNGPVSHDFGRSVRGSMRGFGVEREVCWPGSESTERWGDSPELPLSLMVGAWLLVENSWPTPAVQFQSVSAGTSPGQASALAATVATSSPRVALVVMGDGSAALTAKAPRYLVPGASQWQTQLTKAIATADREALQALTGAEAEAVHAGGVAAWWVLAASAADGQWTGELMADSAPYGVGYTVATWLRDVSVPKGSP